MKCDYIKLFVNDYIDGYLSVEQSRIIEKHVKNCRNCFQTIEQIKSQIDELVSLESPGLSKKFTDVAINNVESQWIKKHSGTSKTPVYFSIAASLLVASAIIFMLPRHSLNQLPIEQTVASINQQKINMVFNSPNALQNVRFTVILPNNVEMVGHPGKRQVVWFGDLSAGSNLLSIPVMSTSNLSGVLLTKLEYADNTRIFKVKMNNPRFRS